jgi:spore germination protein KA
VNSPNGFAGAKLPSDQLKMNVEYIRNLFANDDTLQFRNLSSPFDDRLHFCLIFADGMINNKLMNDDIVSPLLHYKFPEKIDDLMEQILQHVMLSNSVQKTADIEEIVQAIVYGDTVLLAEGCSDSLILNTKGWTVRAISEPETERVIRGPREGFNESLLINISMLRRKLRTPDLKLRYMTFGRRSRTKACICYLDSLVNKKVLAELEDKLSQIDIDGTLDSNYIAELLRPKPFTLLETTGNTERPDVVAARLLEGRIALIVDGTPTVLTVPHLFVEYMQSDEDYYVNFTFASIGRILRFLAFFLTISMPAIYISLITFHQEMLPTSLLLSIAQSRQNVPFPSALEMTVMLIVFEMLRETGARMPGIMGQALSIVGALVIGQAAVEAKLVSAPIIILVSLTAITGLMVPRLKGFSIIQRFFLLGFSCIMGLYGYLLGLLVVLAQLFGMESFGVPIMPNVYDDKLQDNKDIFCRISWKKMILRPRVLTSNRTRQATKGNPK